MNFSVSWRIVAVTSLCVNLALLVVLAVVASSNSVDFLSTLALALAVIAFVVQIIVFIAQSASAGAQVARAEELHGATQRILAAIEEKAEGTRRTVDTINKQMLGALLDKMLPGIEVAPGEARDQAITQAVDEAVRAAGGTASSPVSSGYRNPAARLEFPKGERLQAVARALEDLTLIPLSILRWLGQDYTRYGSAAPGAVGHGLITSVIGERSKVLEERGLARRAEAGWGSHDEVLVLTDLGRDAAAALVDTLNDDFPPAVHRARMCLAQNDLKEAEEHLASAEAASRAEEASASGIAGSTDGPA